MKRSWLTLILGPAALFALLVLPFGLFWSELPDPMAIHWGLTGEPNGSAPPIIALLLLAGFFAVMVAAVRLVLSRNPSEGPSFIAGLVAVGALLAGIAWSSVLANRGAASWSTANEVGLVEVLSLLVTAAGLGWAAWVLAGGRSVVRETPPGATPMLDVADPGNTVWSGRGIGKVTAVIGSGVIVAGLIIWGWTAVLLVAIGLVGLMFAVVRTTVGQRGVVVSLGWWGFPTWTVPLDSIVRAEVEIVNPMAYGGWGYRVRPGVRAVVVRSGDSLRLVRSSGPDLVYTVDDAETGASLVNSLVASTAN